jgi:hypothetical protein
MKPVPTSVLSALLLVCATQTAAQANKDFSAPNAPELVSGFELRDRYKLPKHIGETAIYVDSLAVHHTREEVSTIVWKNADGTWSRSQALEEGPGLLPIKPHLDSSGTRLLTADEARAVEQLIRDPSLYSDKVERTGKLGVGAPFHVMAIVTAYGRTTVKWNGRLLGTSGKLANIILGHE